MNEFFAGSALGPVDRHGRTSLPAFIRSVLARRSGGDSVLLGRHETDPCLIGYDRGTVPRLAAELERRWLRDEAAGADPAGHHARARRLFGLAGEAAIDGRGRILLPELERRRLAIAGHVLFVGTGAAFEVWSLERAVAASTDDIAEIARFHLEQAGLPLAA